MTCIKHPKYTAEKKPRTKCRECTIAFAKSVIDRGDKMLDEMPVDAFFALARKRNLFSFIGR